MPVTLSGAGRASHPLMALAPGQRIVSVNFTTTTSGTIGTVTHAVGATVTKTATKTGRYTIQFGDANTKNTYVRIEWMGYTIVAGDDAGLGTTPGLVAVLRDDDVNTDGTIEVQFVRMDTAADAEVQNGFSVKLVFLMGTEAYR